MYTLRRQIAAPRTHESPLQLARPIEAKRKQSPQSEANVCRHKCNLEKTHLLGVIGALESVFDMFVRRTGSSYIDLKDT